MGKPQVTIEVDDTTGIWTVDGLPMVLVPRHFLVNSHKAVEAIVGVDANARIAYDAGHKSAWHWCDQESKRHGLDGLHVFEHYMRRLSQRGWGQFRVLQADAAAGQATVHVGHSVFVAEYGRSAGRPVCYPFTGWLVGSLEWACSALGHPRPLVAHETSCDAHDGAGRCVFEVAPRSDDAGTSIS
jgi:predicted hydrocarbon binding protein